METTLYCRGCECPDVNEDEIVEGLHLGCGGVVEEVCAHCMGTGEIVEDGRDENGNIERGVNSRKCPFCKAEDFQE